MRIVHCLLICVCSWVVWLSGTQVIALRLWGVETTAEMYAASAISSRRNTAFAKYRFTTPDRTVAHGTSLGTRDAPGHSIRIRYLPGNPAVNGPTSTSYGAGQFAAYGIVGWLLSLWAVRVWRGRAPEPATDGPPADEDATTKHAARRVGRRVLDIWPSLLLSAVIVLAALAYQRLADTGDTRPVAQSSTRSIGPTAP
jgi:hypothetical protein